MVKIKERRISELTQGFKELKLVEQGKLKAKSAFQLLAEIRKNKN